MAAMGNHMKVLVFLHVCGSTCTCTDLKINMEYFFRQRIYLHTNLETKNGYIVKYTKVVYIIFVVYVKYLQSIQYHVVLIYSGIPVKC